MEAHGEGAPRGGHRGHPRRGLQPHRRRKPPRADFQLPGHRQRHVLPPGHRVAALLFRLHRDGKYAQRTAPADAASSHGFAALLGAGDARRRLPLRSGVHAGTRSLRGRSPLQLLHGDPSRSGHQQGQAHRRALGRRRGRLSGGALPGALGGVERPLSRHHARLLAWRRRTRGRPGLPAHRELGSLPGGRAQPVVEHQLHHRARRLHHARSGFLQRQAQRGQRRGESRRGGPQQLLELRRRGRHRRSRGEPHSAEAGPQSPLHLAPLPGDAHDLRGGRAGAHPEGQQQRLLPGQRDQLVRLGSRRGAPLAPRLHPQPHSPAARASSPPARHLPRRPRDPRGGRARRRLVPPRR